MKLDVGKYRSHIEKTIATHYRGTVPTPEDRLEYGAMLGITSSVPLVAVFMIMNDVLGECPQTLQVIAKLIAFYGYDQINL